MFTVSSSLSNSVMVNSIKEILYKEGMLKDEEVKILASSFNTSE